MKYIYTIFFVFMFAFSAISQGLYNNGAVIFSVNGGHIYVNGNTGNLTCATSGTSTGRFNVQSFSITVMGNWINNNSSNLLMNNSSVFLSGNAVQYINGTQTIFNNLFLSGSGIKTLNTNISIRPTGTLAIGTSTLSLNSYTLSLLNSSRSALTYSPGGYIQSETYVSSHTNDYGTSTGKIRWSCNSSNQSPKIFPFGVAGSFIPVTFSLSPASQTLSFLEISTRQTFTASALTSTNANIPSIPAATDSRLNRPFEPYVNNLNWVDGDNNSSNDDRAISGVIDRWWTINASSTVTANIIFSYQSNENTIDNPTGLIGAQYWDVTNNKWSMDHDVYGETPGITNGIGTVTTGTIVVFSYAKPTPFILSSKSVALPIELIDFSGQCVNKELVFDWCTASEKNNHYFTLEYSPDGINFLGIGRVYGNGTTGEKHCYQFITNALGELNYYRLKQTDYDGTNSYSKIIALKSCEDNTNQVIIAHDGKKEIALIINSLSNQIFQLKLHNALGQIIEEKSIEIKEGYNNLPINFENLSNAIYYVSIYNGVEKLISKQIVVSDFSR